ncbi:MAG: hypothetical protein PSN37_03910 [Alphaproteobacteria bacterium]|nr:hypothetical protein [Alphaproteobacteria bacterium]
MPHHVLSLKKRSRFYEPSRLKVGENITAASLPQLQQGILNGCDLPATRKEADGSVLPYLTGKDATHGHISRANRAPSAECVPSLAFDALITW